MRNSSSSQRKTLLPSLADQVYERVRTDIIQGILAPGQKLVELEIATQMGTSQGPVREALQRLEHDGLVERWARSATFVTRVSTEEAYELFYIRTVIEGFAIRRTAKLITSEQCDELQALVNKMEAAGRAGDILTLSEYDMEFHRRICEWSGSASLLRAWLHMSNQIQRFVVQSHPHYYPDLTLVGTRHQPIVETLRTGEPEQASRAVQDHVMLIWKEMQPQSDWESSQKAVPPLP